MVDKELKHEQNILSETLTHIKSLIRDATNNRPYPGISQYDTLPYSGCYEDIEALQCEKHMNSRHYNYIDELYGREKEPYFARLDYSSKPHSEIKTVYVGKSGFEVNSSVNVIDWRSPMAQGYYQNRMKDFCFEEFEYNFWLKRKLLISKGYVNSYYDSFVRDAIDNGITDPFLFAILKRRREEGNITNIIKSIQEMQYDIISQPLDTNIFVQGCAGSGKTMILLHRLSYLYFEYKLNPEKVVVISQNHLLNKQMQNLAGDLDDEFSKILTMTEFYKQLLTTVQKQLESYTFLDDPVELYDTVAFLYSNEFGEKIIKGFKRYKKQFLEKVQIENIFELYPEKSDVLKKMIVNGTLEELLKYINQILNEIPKLTCDKKVIEEKKKIIRNISVRKLYDQIVDGHVKEYFRSHGILYVIYERQKNNAESGVERKEKYRFEGFLWLLFYRLYKGDNSFINNKYPSLICLDEAQDCHINEIKVIEDICKNITWNIYGDLKQCITESSIKSWTEISSMFEQPSLSFILNQNYRNTDQITNFCNSKLDVQMTAIGYHGDVVKEITNDKMLNIIKQKKRTDDIAIVLKNYQQEECIKLQASDLGCNIFSVKEIKGLEFNDVFVIDKDMTNAERYVSYTRALSRLFIVKA